VATIVVVFLVSLVAMASPFVRPTWEFGIQLGARLYGHRELLELIDSGVARSTSYGSAIPPSCPIRPTRA